MMMDKEYSHNDDMGSDYDGEHSHKELEKKIYECKMMIKKIMKYVEMPMDDMDYDKEGSHEDKKMGMDKPSISILMKKDNL